MLREKITCFYCFTLLYKLWNLGCHSYLVLLIVSLVEKFRKIGSISDLNHSSRHPTSYSTQIVRKVHSQK